jgi:type III secretory pathway component EscU
MDVGLQIWKWKKRLRMDHQEVEQEHKDQMGHPEVLRRRQEHRQVSAQASDGNPAHLAFAEAVLHWDQQAAAVRLAPDPAHMDARVPETQAAVVLLARGEEAVQALLRRARAQNLPVRRTAVASVLCGMLEQPRYLGTALSQRMHEAPEVQALLHELLAANGDPAAAQGQG